MVNIQIFIYLYFTATNELIMDLANYFESLSEVEKKNSPTDLFLSGDQGLLFQGRRVSVVGSRNASENGLARAKAVTKALISHNITVVSGLAKGIDTMAHQTAIEQGGKTIAVLGTPLNKVYPKENEGLLELIKKDHLAISQFPEGYPSKPENFPRRNRTMALITDATIIIEATEKSGTRHQGWEALRLGREVYILENVLKASLNWSREMLEYGAHVLTRKNMDDIFSDIPYLTSKFVDVF